jgi:putative hydrolase of the HAD superfamily
VNIRSVIFDIDNTLYSYDAAHAVAFAKLTDFAREHLGMAPEEFRELHRQTNLVLKNRMGRVAANHNRLIRYQNMLEQAGKDVGLALEMNELYWSTLLDAACPTEGAAETMEALHEQGFRVGIGTDMTARLQLMKLRRLGLLPYVDFLVSSEEAGAEKPDPALFELCVEKALVPAECCLFVGDNLEKDVMGAAACGLHSLWFNPHGTVPKVQMPQISSLHEVLNHLE